MAATLVNRYDSLESSPKIRVQGANGGSQPYRKPGKNWNSKRRRQKAWKSIRPNITQDMDEKMDKAMRDIIFQYTRTDQERAESRYEPIDYTGTGFLKK